MRATIIVNPISGKGRAGEIAARVAAALVRRGHEVALRQTCRGGDAQRFAAESCTWSDALVCVGGDGTINEVLNGLTRCGELPALPARRCALAVVPAGLSNVLAKDLALPRDVAGFCDILERGRRRLFDIGMIEQLEPNSCSRRFILMAGTGFDAHIVKVLHERRIGPTSFAEYFTRGLRELMTYVPPRITIEADGKVVSRKATFVQVANVASYGGPFLFATGARPDDGWFRLMWYEGGGGIDVLRLFLGGLSHVPYIAGNVYYGRAKIVRLFADHPAPLQMDGDPSGIVLPATVRLLPGAIPVVCRMPVG